MYLSKHTLRRTVTLSAVAAGLTGAVTVAPAAGASKGPPCTKAALTAGLKRGAVKVPGGKIFDKTFGCAGRYAYAEVNTKQFTLTSVFIVSGNQWVTINRAKPCNKKLIPKKIYKKACLTS